MKIFYLYLFLIISCQNQPTSISSFNNLFGKVLSCSYNGTKSDLYFYSPHIIGVPIKEPPFEHEYFQSIGSKVEGNSIYFESSFKGKSNYQTSRSIISEDSRRLKVTINEGKLFVTAISKLDEKKIPVNPVLYECQIFGQIKFN